MGTTIKDVAKKVGVTPTTVSMVMRNDPRISEKTREKVLKAVKELNYYPNLIGRSLVKGKTNTVAVVSNMFYGPFKIDILNGIDLGVIATEYNINMLTCRPEKEGETLREVAYGRRADGVIVINIKPDREILAAYKKLEIPIIFVEETSEGFGGVRGDNYKGAYMATEHLAKKGRKKIGFINGIYDHLQVTTERHRGYTDALLDNGLKYDESRLLFSKDYNFQEGKAICADMLAKKTDVDAVFSGAGDLVAMGFMRHAKDAGIKMPDDLAMVGYDGLDTGSLISPALTTLKQPLVEMGKTAFEMLAAHMLDKNLKPEIKIFEPELIVRESV
jgi:DNA-binding LacI/PurR family transcriptional regulator